MYTSAHTHKTPELCLVAHGSQCERDAQDSPEQATISRVNGVFIVNEDGSEHRLPMNWGI